MSEVLVDSNVILDVITEDPQWFDWSSQMLSDYANQGDLVINPIIYAEIAIGFNQPEEVQEALPEDFFRRDPLQDKLVEMCGEVEDGRSTLAVQVTLIEGKSGLR